MNAVLWLLYQHHVRWVGMVRQCNEEQEQTNSGRQMLSRDLEAAFDCDSNGSLRRKGC
jgi:hypothetical protein